jgi:hypothetical protein
MPSKTKWKYAAISAKSAGLQSIPKELIDQSVDHVPAQTSAGGTYLEARSTCRPSA